MRKVLGSALIALGAMITSAMAQDTLYLNCTCKTVYNMALDRHQSCDTTPDFMAIVDTGRSTIDLKTPGNTFADRLVAGTAVISAGTINGSWNIPGANLPQKSISIDRISGAYSMSWTNDVPSGVRWTGICTKTAAPQTQF